MQSAVVCLINRARAQWGLPPLRERAQVDAAAQAHTTEMVDKDYFGHTGTNGSDPGARLAQAGYSWSAFGEDIATGDPTPVKVVHAWLSDVVHCQIMMAPDYRDVGVGVSPQPVAGYTTRPGTWTADFALSVSTSPPSRDARAANSCPH